MENIIEQSEINEVTNELIYNFERFELPICFDPHDEIKELNLRDEKIKRIVERYVSIYKKLPLIK